MSVTAALLALAPVVFGLLAISALFSAAETSLTGASRGRMRIPSSRRRARLKCRCR